MELEREWKLDSTRPEDRMNQRFRRLTDLFVNGTTVTMPDGSRLWVQVVNAYERDECISDAQVARARLTLALRENGTERMKVEARLAEFGRDRMVNDVAMAKADDKYESIVADLESDPDWTEKVSIIRRTNFDETAKPATPEERATVDNLIDEWAAAINDRLVSEREWQLRHYRSVSDDELLTDYLDMWLDRRGTEVATAEYGLTEIWYATRYCEATETDDGLDHSRCDGHRQRVFDTKADARSAPERLQELIRRALAELAMGDRDPKDSAKPTNSSDSPPTPNAPEESTPSTSTETPPTAPGISPQPSPTP